MLLFLVCPNKLNIIYIAYIYIYIHTYMYVLYIYIYIYIYKEIYRLLVSETWTLLQGVQQ